MWPTISHQKHPLNLLPGTISLLLQPHQQLRRRLPLQHMQPRRKLLYSPALTCPDPRRRQPGMPLQRLPTLALSHDPIPPPQPAPTQMLRVGALRRLSMPRPRIEQVTPQPHVRLHLFHP